MRYRVEIQQRVGIDMDDEGDELGDGAALVDLACMGVLIVLSFVPYPGLSIRKGRVEIEIEDVTWDYRHEVFRCSAVPFWRQTKASAEATVEDLVASGFAPFVAPQGDVH